ncbi:hypothetical protein BH10BAC2_BH10BAC2_47850 [soil metagenome]
MTKIIKYIVSKTVKPLLQKYLSVESTYTYNGIKLLVSPQVFHPGFFFSTKLLLKYILQLSLKDKEFLELGAGSGLIAFSAAKEGALVTATDINSVAIEYLRKNSRKLNLPIEIILSDLFQNMEYKKFDIIGINPPYYKKQPVTEAQFAWYCGENGEYFSKLFEALKTYIHAQTLVLMILSEDCDIAMIENIAAKYNFSMRCVFTRKNLIEANFIYNIQLSTIG